VNDPTLSHILRLQRGLQESAIEFINEARTVGELPAIITSSSRTVAEQRRLVQAGRSTTMNSYHLQGRAFDIDMYGWNRNDVPEWVWQYIGPLGEAYGFRWGGRWATFRDVGHFEF